MSWNAVQIQAPKGIYNAQRHTRQEGGEHLFAVPFHSGFKQGDEFGVGESIFKVVAATDPRQHNPAQAGELLHVRAKETKNGSAAERRNADKSPDGGKSS